MNQNIKLKFKNPSEDGYNKSICCIKKCELYSEVIDATKRYSTYEIPLCDKHWIKLCNDEETLRISNETTMRQ